MSVHTGQIKDSSASVNKYLKHTLWGHMHESISYFAFKLLSRHTQQITASSGTETHDSSRASNNEAQERKRLKNLHTNTQSTNMHAHNLSNSHLSCRAVWITEGLGGADDSHKTRLNFP